MIRLNEIIQKESPVGIVGISNIMTYYNNIPQTYRAYVEQAYMKGLIAGYLDGSFGGNKTGNRAEASTMLVRLLDKSARVKVDVSKPAEVSLVNANGQMTVEKSKEYALKAFDTARFYSENGKYYLSVDLGTLPEAFKWQPAIVVDSEGRYLYSTVNWDTVGLIGKQVFELEGITQSHIKNGVDAYLSLMVITDKNVTSSSFYRISTAIKGKHYVNNAETAHEGWVDYNNTKQIEGWK